MKEFEIVKLKETIKHLNIKKGCLAILLNNGKSKGRIMLFNNTIKDEYSIVEVEHEWLEPTGQVLPDEVKIEMQKLIKEDRIDAPFSLTAFQEYDNVKLICNKPKYEKYNLFAGAVGIVAENHIIKNKVLVDFTEIAKDNKVNSVCIPVDINDLIKID